MTAADLVSPIASRHTDPIVRAFADQFIPMFFQRRRMLKARYSDENGNLLMPAIPEFLARPPAKRRKGEHAGELEPRPDLNYRRADHCQILCLVWSTVIACTDWATKELREPNPSQHKGYRFLSVERLAELAGVAVWQAESALYDLRAAHQITYTHQYREQLPDGSHHSTGAALRRVSLSLLGRTPCTGRPISYRMRPIEDRRKLDRRRAARQGIAAPIIDAAAATPPAPIPRRESPELPPAELVDQVGAEHPSWLMADVLAEAWRRKREQQ